MNIYISQQRGKEKLVEAFQNAGANVVKHLDSSVKLIIPTVDEELPILAELAPILKTKIMISSEYAVFETRSKSEFHRFCCRHDFPIIPTLQGEMIAKPTYGKGSRGLIKLGRDYIIQPYIDWPEYSADYFADWEGNCLSLIQRQRLDIVNGEATKAKFVWNATIHEQLLRLGKELGLVGHNVIQYFSDGKDFKLIEVNTRFGGGSHLTFDIFNSPKWLLENL